MEEHSRVYRAPPADGSASAADSQIHAPTSHFVAARAAESVWVYPLHRPPALRDLPVNGSSGIEPLGSERAAGHLAEGFSHPLERWLHRGFSGEVAQFPGVVAQVEQLFADIPFASNICPRSLSQRGQRPALLAISWRVGVERVERDHLGESLFRQGTIGGRPRADPFQKRASERPGNGAPVGIPARSTIVAGMSRKLTASPTTCFDRRPVGGTITSGTWTLRLVQGRSVQEDTRVFAEVLTMVGGNDQPRPLENSAADQFVYQQAQLLVKVGDAVFVSVTSVRDLLLRGTSLDHRDPVSEIRHLTLATWLRPEALNAGVRKLIGIMGIIKVQECEKRSRLLPASAQPLEELTIDHRGLFAIELERLPHKLRHGIQKSEIEPLIQETRDRVQAVDWHMN